MGDVDPIRGIPPIYTPAAFPPKAKLDRDAHPRGFGAAQDAPADAEPEEETTDQAPDDHLDIAV